MINKQTSMPVSTAFARAPAGPRLSVAVVTETWPPEINGVAMTIHQLVTWLATRHHVTLVRVRQGADDQGARPPGVETLLMPGVALPRYQGLRMGVPAVRRLKVAWRERRPDVAHVITEGPLGWSAVKAAVSLGIPVLSDFHTNFHHYAAHYGFGVLRRPVLAYLRGLHNRTRATLVPTRALADELHGEGFTGLQVLARGIDTRLFDPHRRRETVRQRWGAGPDDPVLITVGRIAPEKNLTLALTAFEQVRSRWPRARMVIVGDGPTKAGFAQVHPEVHFAGMQTDTALAEHYASADIGVFPSLTETFGNVLLEAMASGLAVVAFDYAAAREHIVHGQCGLAVDRADAKGFIDAVCALAGDRSRVARLGAAARVSALDLDWSAVCQRYEHLLTDSVVFGHD